MEQPRIGALTVEQQEVLKVVYPTRIADLRAETEMAYKLMAGFVTIQLGLATWLAGNPPAARSGAWGIFLLNSLLGVFVGAFLWRNYERRREIVATIHNVVDAWELRTPGRYLPDRAVYTEAYRHSWRGLYLWLIVFFCLMQTVPVFRLL
ncbi:MAG: hypothetical protein KY467_10995 [Gemmatimonadetes bacterium]|nr:hypothetical protein [Gemmatimonadota bacterium]